jgi:hypothetical protein
MLCLQLYDDVFAEASTCGNVAGVAVPVPPADIGAEVPCRVLIKFLSVRRDGQRRSWRGGEGRNVDWTWRDPKRTI